MSPGEITGVITSVAALIAAGGWIANLSLNQIQRRKLAAEADKAELDLGDKLGLNTKTVFSAAGEIIDNLRKEVSRLSIRLTDMETRADILRTSEDKCQEELDKANLRIARLEARAVARDLLTEGTA